MVRRCGVFLVAAGRPDQCRPGDLSNSRDDIANNKNPQYRLGRKWNIFCANTVDRDGDDGAYGGRKEDRGDNDKGKKERNGSPEGSEQ